MRCFATCSAYVDIGKASTFVTRWRNRSSATISNFALRQNRRWRALPPPDAALESQRGGWAARLGFDDQGRYGRPHSAGLTPAEFDYALRDVRMAGAAPCRQSAAAGKTDELARRTGVTCCYFRNSRIRDFAGPRTLARRAQAMQMTIDARLSTRPTQLPQGSNRHRANRHVIGARRRCVEKLCRVMAVRSVVSAAIHVQHSTPSLLRARPPMIAAMGGDWWLTVFTACWAKAPRRSARTPRSRRDVRRDAIYSTARCIKPWRQQRRCACADNPPMRRWLDS